MSSPTGSLIPPAPGTYALILRCDTVRSIRIGRLGVLQLRPGYYVYVGSAFGSGGLRARIRHHQRMAQRPHWHIDYLRLHARLQSVCFCHGSRCEHEWAGRIGAMTGAKMVLRRFGSSDCECGTHLYWFEARPAVSVALAV